ncbi:unnamed protein product [Durusdinium trenchii]|uniref:AraC-type arabinose-binding/dimerisation domain-containing protein n=1 Tax=Durusdinium trenchii TaxID=1381693 RepID=A0ABP0QJ41_9DINO
MGIFECPVSLECRQAAEEWLQSKDVLIQDFGARLMSLLCSQGVPLGHSEHAPPSGLIAEEFQHYPWQVSPLKAAAKHKLSRVQDSAPMRQFFALEDMERLGFRVGVFWVSPEWHYVPHVHESIELHHRVQGRGKYLTDMSSHIELAPGDVYVHLPDKLHGIESEAEPLLTLFAERLVPVEQVPQVISDLAEVSAHLVTSWLKQAANLWLQADEPLAHLFGRELLPLIKPRTLAEKLQVFHDSPPNDMIPRQFRSCPWYPSGAYTACMDPKLKPLKDCIMYRDGNAMFGFFYLPPRIYYPAHRHEPLEIYHVLQGQARFFLGDSDSVDPLNSTVSRMGGPDSFWLHHPYQAHGMQTLDQPVLILWGWIGNLENYDFHYTPNDVFREEARAPLAKL